MENKGIKTHIQLEVEHEGRPLKFKYPGVDFTYFANGVDEISKEPGLRPATFGEVVSLVHASLYGEDEASRSIRDLFGYGMVWGFTGTLFTPKGVYIQDRPLVEPKSDRYKGICAVNDRVVMNREELAQGLREGRPDIRFVTSRDLELGTLTAQEIANSKYVEGLAGVTGREKLANLVDTFRYEEVTPRNNSGNLWALGPCVTREDDQEEFFVRVASFGLDATCGTEITGKLGNLSQIDGSATMFGVYE